jgi:chemotaxis protein histidine kinase CheA
MALAKKTKKTKKAEEQDVEAVEQANEQNNKTSSQTKKVSSSASKKLSLHKVQNLFPEAESDQKEEIKETKPKAKSTASRKTSSSTTSTKTKSKAAAKQTLTIEAQDQAEEKLLTEIQAFAKTHNLKPEAAVLLLVKQALTIEAAKKQFNLELGEGLQKIEDKVQHEIDGLKIEIIEQFQCFLDAARVDERNLNEGESKTWLQKILKYI